MMNFAKRSGLSYAAIRKLAMGGKLPHVKVGNRYMIHIEKVLPPYQNSLIERVVHNEWII